MHVAHRAHSSCGSLEISLLFIWRCLAGWLAGSSQMWENRFSNASQFAHDRFDEMKEERCWRKSSFLSQSENFTQISIGKHRIWKKDGTEMERNIGVHKIHIFNGIIRLENCEINKMWLCVHISIAVYSTHAQHPFEHLNTDERTCSVHTQQFPLICLFVLYNVHIQMVLASGFVLVFSFSPISLSNILISIFRSFPKWNHYTYTIFIDFIDARTMQLTEFTRRTPFATEKCIDASSVALHENMNKWTEICIRRKKNAPKPNPKPIKYIECWIVQ